MRSTELKEIKEEEAATLLSSGCRSFISTMGKSSYNVAILVDFSREHLPEGYYIAIYICNWLDKGSDKIVFKAMGRAINKTVTIMELIKYTTIGSTDITDTWEPLEEGLLP
ncbi:putative DNA/RNA-binding protein Alba [Rosa chinensis]|uniref:Putative DNA/RNA-binding protein Alba n=1 Tax=Rosa chinensis TaxID=74649 RepID=A0A2P6PPP9_ROSCH|nr:putative DNA/RNA-binding protein Alba [Rosa chinensis]